MSFFAFSQEAPLSNRLMIADETVDLLQRFLVVTACFTTESSLYSILSYKNQSDPRPIVTAFPVERLI
jgi:hypothetical protein